MKQKIFKIYSVTALAGLALPLLAQAQTTIPVILGTLLGWGVTIFRLLFVAATVVFLYGIVLFIAKSADEAARKKSRGIMTWGIVGLAVMAAGWGIANTLLGSFGIGPSTPTVSCPPGYPGCVN